jgi:hypothetical protein
MGNTAGLDNALVGDDEVQHHKVNSRSPFSFA